MSDKQGVQLALRCPGALAEELETLIADYQRQAPPGVHVQRSTVMREALSRGIAELRKELGGSKKRRGRA